MRSSHRESGGHCPVRSRDPRKDHLGEEKGDMKNLRTTLQVVVTGLFILACGLQSAPLDGRRLNHRRRDAARDDGLHAWSRIDHCAGWRCQQHVGA